MRKACKSVLATMNSMCSMPESIMRLTALLPPPPTPMTLMRASLRASSLKQMRSPLSSFINHLVESVVSCQFSVLSPNSVINSSLPVERRASPPGWTGETPLAPPPQSSRALTREQRLHARTEARLLQAPGDAGAVAGIRHAQHRRELRLG